MTIFLYVLLFLVVLILSKIYYKTVFNLNVLFTGIWCFFGIMSHFDFLELRIPINTVHYLSLLFLAPLNIISILSSRKHSKTLYVTANKSKVISRAYFLNIIAICLLLPLLYKSITLLLQTGDFALIRTETYFDTSATYYSTLFLRNIPIAILYSLIVVYIYWFVKNGQKNVVYMLLAALSASLIIIASAGRAVIIFFVFSYVIAVLSNTGKPVKIKYSYFIIAALVLFLTTLARTSDTLFRTACVYYSGSFSFLDLILSTPERFGLNTLHYGQMTFGFIVEPVLIALKVLGVTDAKVPSYYFNIYCQNFYNIGSTRYQMFNNNTSILYYFLADFGIWGVLLGSLFFGWLLSHVAKKHRAGSDFYGYLYIYIGIALCNSIMTYQLFGLHPIIIFASFLLMRNEKKLKRSKC